MATAKQFNSSKAMLEWQYMKLLGQLQLLQEHAEDGTCPCKLRDMGEYCMPKHALHVAELAHETAPMDEANGAMLAELGDDGIELHKTLKAHVCSEGKDADVVTWSRQWRKRIEPIYYACSHKKAAHLSDGGPGVTSRRIRPMSISVTDSAIDSQYRDGKPERVLNLAGDVKVYLGGDREVIRTVAPRSSVRLLEMMAWKTEGVSVQGIGSVLEESGEKERQYDRVVNEGGEGPNPHRDERRRREIEEAQRQHQENMKRPTYELDQIHQRLARMDWDSDDNKAELDRLLNRKKALEQISRDEKVKKLTSHGWTSETVTQRRAIWNAEIRKPFMVTDSRGRPDMAKVVALEKRLGFTLTELKEAVEAFFPVGPLAENIERGHVVCKTKQGDLVNGPVHVGHEHDVTVDIRCPNDSEPAAIMHNHPNGNINPSEKDIETSKKFNIPVCVQAGGETKCYQSAK